MKDSRKFKTVCAFSEAILGIYLNSVCLAPLSIATLSTQGEGTQLRKGVSGLHKPL